MEDKPAVSFGFSKKVDTKKLSTSVAGENAADRKAETDFVLSLEGNEVKSTAAKQKSDEPYVIPLIKKNKWREGAEKRFADVKKHDPDDLDQQAAREFLEDTAKYNESWEDRDKPDPNLAIPLLMQNKVPEGFETDDKLDVALRPDVPDDADYEQIPIEHFGFAMLRGMGWKEGQGIGKSGKLIAPIEASLRPKGLGLGADRSQSSTKPNEKDNKSNNKSSSKDEEDFVMKKGAFCVILNGKHKDLYGVVEGVDEDNARLVIKLALSGQSVTQTQYNAKLVGKKEYDKYSKYLNKGKADKYKEDEEKQNENGDDHHGDKRSRDRDDDRSDRDKDSERSSRKRDKDRSEDGEGSRKRKQKYEEENTEDSRSKHHKSSSSSSSSKSKNSDKPSNNFWLRKDLRVRVVDKHFMKGKYYKEKVVVVDVISFDNTACRTADGKVIDGLASDQLETVIPKHDNAYVMLCSGKFIGQLGKIVKKKKDTCQALVQLIADRDRIVDVNFDDICEYMGNIDDEFDY